MHTIFQLDRSTIATFRSIDSNEKTADLYTLIAILKRDVEMKLKTLVLSASLLCVASIAMAKPATYTIDPTHTATVFTWDHMGFSTPSGNFSDIQGHIVVDNDKPEKSSVNVTIPLSSINTNVKALDEHLLKADFFDAEKFPIITFKSTKVETKDKKNFKITGDLTIKGITKPVVLDTVLNKQAEHPMAKVPAIGFNATTSFDRSIFGLGAAIPNVGDKITVNITTEATIPADKK